MSKHLVHTRCITSNALHSTSCDIAMKTTHTIWFNHFLHQTAFFSLFFSQCCLKLTFFMCLTGNGPHLVWFWVKMWAVRNFFVLHNFGILYLQPHWIGPQQPCREKFAAGRFLEFSLHSSNFWFLVSLNLQLLAAYRTSKHSMLTSTYDSTGYCIVWFYIYIYITI